MVELKSKGLMLIPILAGLRASLSGLGLVLGLGTIGIATVSLSGQPESAIAQRPQAHHHSEASASRPKTIPQRLAPPVALLETAFAQGDTVVAVGQTLPIPWQQQGDRIGIADIPLMRHLGVELQNTLTPGEQPVLWFSEQPQTLPTWHANGHRYVDITDWAAQRGWQLQPNGGSLRIDAPAHQVLTGRRGRQTWGDRLVLEVDRPTLWSLTETNNTFTLTLRGNTAPSFQAASLTAGPGNVLQNLQVQSSGGQLQIQGTFSSTARPHVWSLTNPHRVVIDLTQADIRPKDIVWAPGLRWREEYVRVGDRPFPVHQLWLELGRGVTMRPIWPDPTQIPGIAPLGSTAEAWGAVAAINAGFFNRNNQLPLGAVRHAGEWITGPILNRGAIAWDNQGGFQLSRLFLNHTLTSNSGATFPVSQINSGYPEAGVALYTPAWGSTYQPVTDSEVLLTVQGNQVTQQTTAATAGTGSYPIPADGYLLAARSYSEVARALPPGTSLSLTPEVRPVDFIRMSEAIQGGPVLVQGGRIVADAKAEQFSGGFANQAAPRSAVGVRLDGRLVLVAMHNSPGGRGPTLQEAAQIMVQLGAQDALNLDGGNSSSLYLGGSLINRHPSTAGRVHNALGVFLTQEGH